MNEKLKEIARNIGLLILVFTFGFPIIPLAGVALYDHLTKPESTEVKAASDTNPIEVEVEEPFDSNEFVLAVNSYRTANAVATMLYETTVISSAQANLSDMQTYDYVDTVNPTTQKTGHSFISDKTDNCSYINTIAGYVNGDAQNTLDVLTSNQAIKDSLLDARYDYYGIATDDKRLTIHMCDKRVVTPARYTPSYNYFGDLDCADIGYEHYVGYDDPHGLDRDGDGWACEGW